MKGGLPSFQGCSHHTTNFFIYTMLTITLGISVSPLKICRPRNDCELSYPTLHLMRVGRGEERGERGGCRPLTRHANPLQVPYKRIIILFKYLVPLMFVPILTGNLYQQVLATLQPPMMLSRLTSGGGTPVSLL